MRDVATFHQHGPPQTNSASLRRRLYLVDAGLGDVDVGDVLVPPVIQRRRELRVAAANHQHPEPAVTPTARRRRRSSSTGTPTALSGRRGRCRCNATLVLPLPLPLPERLELRPDNVLDLTIAHQPLVLGVLRALAVPLLPVGLLAVVVPQPGVDLSFLIPLHPLFLFLAAAAAPRRACTEPTAAAVAVRAEPAYEAGVVAGVATVAAALSKAVARGICHLCGALLSFARGDRCTHRAQSHAALQRQAARQALIEALLDEGAAIGATLLRACPRATKVSTTTAAHCRLGGLGCGMAALRRPCQHREPWRPGSGPS
jgi:hypothetical protein